MLSDESSSDSETGRFKCQATSNEEQRKSSTRREDIRPHRRQRPPENDKFRREFDKKKDDRDHGRRRSRERYRSSRLSPALRRRSSKERSPIRQPQDRHGHGSHSRRSRSKPRDHRSHSRDRHTNTTSRSHRHRSPEHIRDFKEIIRSNIMPKEKEKSVERPSRNVRDKMSSSPEYTGKRSVVQKPAPAPIPVEKRKSDSPIIVEDHESDRSEEVQLGSYYNMIPAVVKEKSEESSEIDSSDDEKLRAKLLNLEKKLHKTKKKKQKKKHKRKKSKEREQEASNSVEVTSTTDIEKVKSDSLESQPEVVEVSSTQRNIQKESSEEGELSSDEDDSQTEYDPNDLRHKLKRSAKKVDACSPSLPPHSDKQSARSPSLEIEGPALPPHLQRKSKNIGPSIPQDMRQVLAAREVKYESSDDDGIGPLPAGAQEKWSDAHRRLEERALDMKIRKLDGHSLNSKDIKSREQWMLELPEGKAKYIGLEARSFRAKEGPDMSDRSSWTDTPEEKARKAAGIVKEEDAELALKREARARAIATRDDEHDKAIRKHKKKHKRDESLLDMHQKKLKKKRKKEEKEEGRTERRPFSRDVDLQVNRFDDAQKKSIIKKSQELDSRFSRGEAKYL